MKKKKTEAKNEEWKKNDGKVNKIGFDLFRVIMENVHVFFVLIAVKVNNDRWSNYLSL